MVHNLPLLSIVIPTRNRFLYAQFSIQSILRIPDRGIELVVEDNSDTNDLNRWIGERISDDRLKYSCSQYPVSMSENYDRAVKRATGEYICLLGDDDGINPGIVKAVRWAKENDFDAVLPNNCVHFVWPDLNLPTSGAISPGELRVYPFTGLITYPNAEEEIIKCFQDAGQKFHDLPKVYYGVVKRICMEKVRTKTGTYFPGISPDMAAAISSANFVKKMCLIDYPLFVPGSSKNSNAGLSGVGKHIGRLKDQSHLPKNCEETWSNIVPPFYSVETIWAESAVEAIIAMERMDILGQFNLGKLYAELIMWHPAYLKISIITFFKALRTLKKGYLIGILLFLYHYLGIINLRAKSLFTRLFYKKDAVTVATTIQGLHNIDEAVLGFEEYLKNHVTQFDLSKLNL